PARRAQAGRFRRARARPRLHLYRRRALHAGRRDLPLDRRACRTSHRSAPGVHRRPGISLSLSSQRASAMIELSDARLDIGGRVLLDGLDARFAPGELVAVLGRNGVGKTTLLRAIAGLHATARGAILIDGASVTALNPMERALRVALVAGDDVLLDALRVRDVVAIGRFPHHRW